MQQTMQQTHPHWDIHSLRVHNLHNHAITRSRGHKLPRSHNHHEAAQIEVMQQSDFVVVKAA